MDKYTGAPLDIFAESLHSRRGAGGRAGTRPRVDPATPTTPPPPSGARRRRARLSGDRGSTTTEMVIAFPLLMLLIALGIQVGLWALGQLGTQHAANHALQATRAGGGTTAAGRQDATATLQQITGAFIHDPTVTVTRTLETTTVSITGHATTVFGVSLPVRTTVSAPTERFRPFTLAGQP